MKNTKYTQIINKSVYLINTCNNRGYSTIPHLNKSVESSERLNTIMK